MHLVVEAVLAFGLVNLLGEVNQSDWWGIWKFIRGAQSAGRACGRACGFEGGFPRGFPMGNCWCTVVAGGGRSLRGGARWSCRRQA
jgi:hypothetical protein